MATKDLRTESESAMRQTSPVEAARYAGYFVCANEHVFPWVTADASPTHCVCSWQNCDHAREWGMVGDPCGDSSVLLGPFDNPDHALRAGRAYNAEWFGRPPGGRPELVSV